MKILVTGRLGFIGSNFCRFAIKAHQDVEVVNVDKIGIGANPSNLKNLKKEKRYRFVKGDTRDSKLLVSLVARACN
jgi:dTDP-glucose 4,6-dehydratase